MNKHSTKSQNIQHSISANRKKSFTITTVSQSNVGNKNVGHKTGISDFIRKIFREGGKQHCIRDHIIKRILDQGENGT